MTLEKVASVHYSFYPDGTLKYRGSGVNVFPGTDLAYSLPGITSNSLEQVEGLLTARGYEIPEDLELQMVKYVEAMDSNPAETLPASTDLGYTRQVGDAMTDIIRISNEFNSLVIGSNTFTISD